MFGWVQVVAVAANEEFNSEPARERVEVVPGAPKITGKVGANGKPVITWIEVPEGIIYEIYRSTKSSSGFTLIGEVENMSEFDVFVPEYEDTTAVKGKTYYYKVVARSWNSTSAQSNVVKVKSK